MLIIHLSLLLLATLLFPLTIDSVAHVDYPGLPLIRKHHRTLRSLIQICHAVRLPTGRRLGRRQLLTQCTEVLGLLPRRLLLALGKSVCMRVHVHFLQLVTAINGRAHPLMILEVVVMVLVLISVHGSAACDPVRWS